MGKSVKKNFFPKTWFFNLKLFYFFQTGDSFRGGGPRGVFFPPRGDPFFLFFCKKKKPPNTFPEGIFVKLNFF